MKILQVIPDFGLGGIQKAGCLLGESMAERGHEIVVLGRQAGPRYRNLPQRRLRHEVHGSPNPADRARRLLAEDPDVIHVHAHAYDEPLIMALAEQKKGSRPLLVSTPVFGRPPQRRGILKHTDTCCVGVYTSYRLRKWLRFGDHEAMDHRLYHVPLTPFVPPRRDVSTNDQEHIRIERRGRLGLDADSFIVGRVARNDPSKWHPRHESFINRLLERNPAVAWASVGYPDQLGLRRLANRWGRRFHNLTETPDYGLLAEFYASLDVHFFHSPNGECFASTICESAGFGLPTVGVSTPLRDNGQAEQIVNGITGWLVADQESALERIALLMADSESVAALKVSSQTYARTRWLASRVADDLLSMYEAGLNPESPDNQYLAEVQLEQKAFAETYRRRVVQLHGRSPLRRWFWRSAIRSAEWWPAFVAGRFSARVVRRVLATVPIRRVRGNLQARRF